ncbi:MAG: DNA topoisomerase IB [Cyanobacteria bacterium J06606_4]
MSSLKLYQNAEKSAKIAGLRYVSDDQPGIRRQRWGRGFSYIDVDGTRIKDKALRSRIEALAIPPSWRDVWICCDHNGHLRATGRDLKRRKQYRYHPDWIALRKQLKFDRLIPFAQALPTLRKHTQAQLEIAAKKIKLKGKNNSQKIDKQTLLAAIVKILDTSFIRIGNQQYAKQNNAYGLTTLKKRHADVSAGQIELQFIGKSGVERDIDLEDPQLAKVIKKCEEIPGQTLFQYMDEDNRRQPIDSGDVNEYLQTIMGSAFTAKDFRTWGGTVTAAQALYNIATGDAELKEKPPEKHIVEAVKIAAKQLGNRPATCRKYYIHPSIFDAYTQGSMMSAIAQSQPKDLNLTQFLNEDELRTLAILMT